MAFVFGAIKCRLGYNRGDLDLRKQVTAALTHIRVVRFLSSRASVKLNTQLKNRAR